MRKTLYRSIMRNLPAQPVHTVDVLRLLAVRMEPQDCHSVFKPRRILEHSTNSHEIPQPPSLTHQVVEVAQPRTVYSLRETQTIDDGSIDQVRLGRICLLWI